MCGRRLSCLLLFRTIRSANNSHWSHSNMAPILRRSMPSTTRRNYMILNYFLMVINSLIFVISLAAVGLSGNMLYWATNANNSNTLYLLHSTIFSESNPPPSPDISEYPAGFRLQGTQLIMAAGIATMIVAVITMLLVYIWSLQPTKVRAYLSYKSANWSLTTHL